MKLSDIGSESLKLMGMKPKPIIKNRARVGTGDTSVQKHWEAEMARLPGAFLPIRIISEANIPSNMGQKWAQINRKKRQHDTVAIGAAHYLRPIANRSRKPWTVKLTRYGKAFMDDDNLAIGFKFVRDEVATMLGVDDSMRSPIRFMYAQELAKHYGIRIEISEGVLKSEESKQ